MKKYLILLGCELFLAQSVMFAMEKWDDSGSDKEIRMPSVFLTPIRLDVVRFVHTNTRIKETRTPLQDAIFNRKYAEIESLLANKANPNQSADNAVPPLHRAIIMGDFTIVQMLLDYGANPNLIVQGTLSPLALVLGNRKPDELFPYLALLFQAGANFSFLEKSENPLHAAIESNEVECVKLVLGEWLSIQEKAKLYCSEYEIELFNQNLFSEDDVDKKRVGMICQWLKTRSDVCECDFCDGEVESHEFVKNTEILELLKKYEADF